MGLMLAVLLCACAAPPLEVPRDAVAESQPPAAPAAEVALSTETTVAAPPAPNFELAAYQVVEDPEDDTLEYFEVFLGTQAVGRTDIAPKSRRKLWLGALPEGNHLMRFEVFDSTDGVCGVSRSPERQPRERFIRVAPGQMTRLVLKAYDQGRRFLFNVSRD